MRGKKPKPESGPSGSRRQQVEAGDSVMLSAPFADPTHWWLGKVLWTDGMEVLVEQSGIAGISPHKAIHDVSYVRCFGSTTFCATEKRHAATIVRDAARQCAEVEDLAADLRRRLMELFETVAAASIKACQDRAS